MAQALRTASQYLDSTSVAQVPQGKKSSSQISSFPTWEAEPHGVVWLTGGCHARAMCLLTSTKVLTMVPYQVAHRWLAAFLWCEIQGQWQLHQTGSICPPGVWVGRGFGALLEEVE